MSAPLSRPLSRRLALGLLWWLAGAGIVGAATLIFSAVVLLAPALAGSMLGELQRAVWLGLGRAVAFGALGPVLGWTVLAWLALASFWPGLDAGWGRLAPGVLLVAAVGFPPVGVWLFAVWTPAGPGDWLGTGFWIAGGASAALLLARRLLPPLAPGALSGPDRRRRAG